MGISIKKIAAAFAFTVLVTAVAAAAVILISRQNADYKAKEQPVPLTDFVVAESDSSGYTIQLVMTDGEYFDIGHTTPGGGICEENYSGKYRLDVLKENQLVSSAEIGTMLFGKKFELEFDDYNFDGNADFSIGQWAGSNYNEFMLYSLDENGDITPIGSILTSEGKGEKDYSLGFSHENNVITTQIYDQIKGKSTAISYKWDVAEKSFVSQK